MKSEINLSGGIKHGNSIFRKMLYVSVGIFSVTVVISIGLIGYRLILNNNFNNLQNEQESLSSQVLPLSQKKDKYLETQKRLKDATLVLAKRNNVVQKIDDVTQNVEDGQTLSSITGSDSDVEMTVESTNLSSLNSLMQEKILNLSKNKKEGVQKINIESFSLDPKTLNYKVTFGITFNKS